MPSGSRHPPAAPRVRVPLLPALGSPPSRPIPLQSPLLAAMPTVAQLSKELTKLKLKEVPGHVQKFAGQHWTPAQLQGRLMNWLHNYKLQVNRDGTQRAG